MARKPPVPKRAPAPKQDPRAAAPDAPPAPPATATSGDGTHTSVDGAAADAERVSKRAKKADSELVSVTVHTAFNLVRDNGEKVRYEQGVQDVPRGDAEHYYAVHHLDKNED